MTVATQQQAAAEARAEAERVDEEVGQVDEVNRVGEAQVIAIGRRVQALPQPLAPLPATFGR
jgi:hypothetical protein